MSAGLRPAGRRRGDDDQRILPLINVVFLLLIFFMVAGRLTASDVFAIQPPSSASEASPGSDLMVLVATDGRLALGGEPLERQALSAAVRERLASSESGTGVRIKADGRVEARRVVAIMEELRAAGVEQLELLTLPERS